MDASRSTRRPLFPNATHPDSEEEQIRPLFPIAKDSSSSSSYSSSSSSSGAVNSFTPLFPIFPSTSFSSSSASSTFSAASSLALVSGSSSYVAPGGEQESHDSSPSDEERKGRQLVAVKPSSEKRPRAADFFRSVVSLLSSSDSEEREEEEEEEEQRRKHKRKTRTKEEEEEKRQKKRKRDDKKGTTRRKKDKERKRKKKHKKERERAKEKRKSRKKVGKEEEGKRELTAAEREKELRLERQLAKEDIRRASMRWLDPSKEYDNVEELFEYNFKGDRNNLVFGYLYTQDIPRYHRRQRFCLGLPSNERLSVSKHFGYLIINLENSTTHSARYCNPKFAVGMPTSSSYSSSVKGKKTTKKDKQEGEAEQDQQAEESERNGFISLAGYSSDEEDGQFESDAEEEEEETVDEYLRRRTREYNEQTREHPKDIKLWLQYIAFQDEYQALSSRGGASAKLVLDKKLAIYEKALAANSNSFVLLSGYLLTSAKVLDGERTLRLWEQTLNEHPADVKLWKLYISFRISSFSTFTVSEIRETFISAIQTLNEQRLVLMMLPTSEQNLKQDERRRTERKREKELRRMEQAMLEVFVQACYFEKRAGYSEKAIAMFQALLEFNCFAPDASLLLPGANEAITAATAEERRKKKATQTAKQMKRMHQAKLKFFEAFWESETSRLGESDAKGWQAWIEATMQSSKTATETTTKTSINEAKEEEKRNEEDEAGGSAFSKWAKEEDRLDSICILPQTSKNTPTHLLTDPERVVLFEDIKHFLFSFAFLEDGERLLLFHFLRFIGLYHVSLDFASTSTSFHTSTNKESTEREEDDQGEEDIAFASSEARLDVTDRLEDLSSLFQMLSDPVAHSSKKSTKPMNETNEEQEDILRMIPTDLATWTIFAHQRFRPLINDDVKVFVSNVLSQTRSALFAADDDLALAHIRLIASPTYNNASQQQHLEGLRKGCAMAKSLLSAQRTNLVLYHEYALMENATGNVAQARKVYSMALTMLKSLSEEARRHTFLLLRGFAEMEFYRMEGGEGEGDEEQKREQRRLENERRALHILSSLNSGETFDDLSIVSSAQGLLKEVPPTKLLKARKVFKQALQAEFDNLRPKDHLLDGSMPQRLKHIGIAYAIFEYLASGLEDACNVFETVLDGLERGPSSTAPPLLNVNTDLEYFWIAHASYHSNVPPGRLRQLVEQRALKTFPSSPVLLSLFIKGEARSKIENRIRRHFDAALERYSREPLLWLFAVRSEVMRLGSAHRIRSLFERAVSSVEFESCADCALLWRYYIQFELREGEKEAAQRVYFRAIHQTPFSKALWLDALRNDLAFPSATSSSSSFAQTAMAAAEEEQTKLVELILEKEIRLRNDALPLSTSAND
ncbi:Reverse transcriptase domain-containing protein [Balamuthia mandrillaris]